MNAQNSNSVFSKLLKDFINRIRNKFILLTLPVLICITASGQDEKVKHNQNTKLDSRKGYISINDLTYGLGLSNTNVPYSKSYLGFNTIHGYQINKNYVIALGTGYFVYKEGNALPLFMDVRYRFYTTSILTSFIYGDGGFIFHVSGLKEGSKVFINPGIGLRYDFSKDLAGNFGIGMMVQQGTIRSSFINIKVGMTLKP